MSQSNPRQKYPINLQWKSNVHLMLNSMSTDPLIFQSFHSTLHSSSNSRKIRNNFDSNQMKYFPECSKLIQLVNFFRSLRKQFQSYCYGLVDSFNYALKAPFTAPPSMFERIQWRVNRRCNCEGVEANLWRSGIRSAERGCSLQQTRALSADPPTSKCCVTKIWSSGPAVLSCPDGRSAASGGRYHRRPIANIASFLCVKITASLITSSSSAANILSESSSQKFNSLLIKGTVNSSDAETVSFQSVSQRQNFKPILIIRSVQFHSRAFPVPITVKSCNNNQSLSWFLILGIIIETGNPPSIFLRTFGNPSAFLTAANQFDFRVAFFFLSLSLALFDFFFFSLVPAHLEQTERERERNDANKEHQKLIRILWDGRETICGIHQVWRKYMELFLCSFLRLCSNFPVQVWFDFPLFFEILWRHLAEESCKLSILSTHFSGSNQVGRGEKASSADLFHLIIFLFSNIGTSRTSAAYYSLDEPLNGYPTAECKHRFPFIKGL